MTTTMEVDDWEEGNLGLDIVASLGSCKLFGGIVVRVHICLVVLAMVEFHDFAVDGGFQCAIIV